jgi:hypothetical protein
MKHRQARSAGILALVCLIFGPLFLLVPAQGAEYVAGPGIIVIGLVCSWFWKKGTYGSDKDKEWVEANF